MTGGHADERPITSVAELVAAGAARADRTADRYAARAAACVAAGNAEAAGVLQRLAAERRANGIELTGRAGASGRPSGDVASAPSTASDELADEDPYTVTAYRLLSIAVHDATRAFQFYAYVAAQAAERDLQQAAEALAHEQLRRAALLRCERRKAWRQTPRGCGGSLLPPGSRSELLEFAGRQEGDMAVRHAALAAAAAALDDPESARVLRSVAAEAAGLLPRGAYPAPAGPAVTPAATRSFELLRAALVDLEDAYGWYIRVAEGRSGEEAMLDAQRWAASAMRRSSLIRGRLTALHGVAAP